MYVFGSLICFKHFPSWFIAKKNGLINTISYWRCGYSFTFWETFWETFWGFISKLISLFQNKIPNQMMFSNTQIIVVSRTRSSNLMLEYYEHSVAVSVSRAFVSLYPIDTAHRLLWNQILNFTAKVKLGFQQVDWRQFSLGVEEFRYFFWCLCS